MNSFIRTFLCIALLLCAFTVQAGAADSKADLTGFVDLFDGKTLDGWQKLTSYNESGKWEVIDGCIAGDQWPEGEGGLLVTKKKYSNYELYAEVKTTYPQDSGLFLRVQPDGKPYVPESGVIGVQVHPGENWKKGSKVLFRKIMIKELK